MTKYILEQNFLNEGWEELWKNDNDGSKECAYRLKKLAEARRSRWKYNPTTTKVRVRAVTV